LAPLQFIQVLPLLNYEVAKRTQPGLKLNFINTGLPSPVYGFEDGYFLQFSGYLVHKMWLSFALPNNWVCQKNLPNSFAQQLVHNSRSPAEKNSFLWKG
jgi:hypothetical protein